VVTEASGVERDGPFDRRQYGIESPVSSVIEVLKWSLTLSHSDSQFAPQSGWTHCSESTHCSEGGSIRDKRERGISNVGASPFAGVPHACQSRSNIVAWHLAFLRGRGPFPALCSV